MSAPDPTSTPTVADFLAARNSMEPEAPAPAGKKSRKSTVIYGAGLLLFLILGAVLGGMTRGPADPVTCPAPAPAASAPVIPAPAANPAPAPVDAVPAVPAGPLSKFGSGTYVVGEDIKPGTYKSNGESGYWARLSNTDGSFDSIIANGNVTGPATVTIKPTDKAFTTSGAIVWTRRGAA
jgi:hypothetical protein